MKKVLVKVYHPDNSFINVLQNVTFAGFTKEINAGLGNCILEVGFAFDYIGNEIKLGNNVEILISDKETTTLTDGYLLIYSGYISKYTPWIKDAKEGITVELLGHYTKLSTDILRDSTQTSLYTKAVDGITNVLIDMSPAEISDVIKGIIYRYISEATQSVKMLYDGNTIQDTGCDVEYTFEAKTYRNAIDKLVSAAPPWWFWYFDEFFNFYFKVKPTTPTHTFIMGKHFQNLKVSQDMEKVRNVLLIWNGESSIENAIYRRYENIASSNIFGQRTELLYDFGIGDTTTADNIGHKFVDENGIQEITITCDILDSNENNFGYDIESIKPGDTCRFIGFNEAFADVIRDNMLISKVGYTLNKVELTVEATKGGILEWQKQTSKKVDDLSFEGMPEDYVVA